MAEVSACPRQPVKPALASLGFVILLRRDVKSLVGAGLVRTCDGLHLSLQYAHNQNCHHISKSRGSSFSRFRFSNRTLDRNVSRSEIEVGTHGDSNSFEGEFEVKERRLDGAPGVCAPNWIHFELINIKMLKSSVGNGPMQLSSGEYFYFLFQAISQVRFS